MKEIKINVFPLTKYFNKSPDEVAKIISQYIKGDCTVNTDKGFIYIKVKM